MIALQHVLDLHILIAVRTAPGHSYTNPPEKINCILNLGLSGIGCMGTSIHSNPGFEKQLFNCSGVDDDDDDDDDDVGNLLKRNPTVHTNLLKQLCSNYLSLINLFSVDYNSKVKHS